MYFHVALQRNRRNARGKQTFIGARTAATKNNFHPVESNQRRENRQRDVEMREKYGGRRERRFGSFPNNVRQEITSRNGIRVRKRADLQRFGRGEKSGVS